MLRTILAVCGALGGAVTGHLGFVWIVRQGLYAMLLPGVLAGFGAGFAKSNSRVVPWLSGAIGLAAGLYSEWAVFPFRKDGSLSFFLAHVHQLRPIAILMILGGAAFAVWSPWRESRNHGSSGDR